MKFIKVIYIVIAILISAALIYFSYYYIRNYTAISNQTFYTAEDFGITTIHSSTDKDNDGIDDYTDIMLGARIDAKNKPKYKSEYYQGGYPPDEEGVCTDVVWRAFKNAGYLLKDMVDEDIKNNVSKYPRVNNKPDPNIDFRRVPNLKVYFERNHISLTTDLTKIEEWQPGDIVVFGSKHIGIISDKRNKKGVPFLIHNGGQQNREEDFIEMYNAYDKITGHYRLKDSKN